MLRGSYTATIDEKGRVKIPAAFKRYLDQQYSSPDLYVTSLNGDCVKLYPLAEWEEIENRLALLPSLDPAKRKFLDRTNYYGQVQSIDAQGRVLIHPLVRSAAELLGEVRIFGYLTYLEIWSADQFRVTRLSVPYTDEDAEALSRLGI